jgi:hypothetical protein
MIYLLSVSTYIGLLWLFGLNELAIPGHFFIPHDTFYPINEYLNSTSFASFNSAFNYRNNLAGLMVLSPDVLTIFILKLFFSNQIVQVIHTLLCLLTFHALSFWSLNYIYRRSHYSYLLTLCYCFSPFSSIFYSAGIIYQLSTAIGLGVLPLFLFKVLNLEREKDTFCVIFLTIILTYGLLFIYPALLLILFSFFLIWRKTNYINVFRIIKDYAPSKKYYILLLPLLTPIGVFVFMVFIIGGDKSSYLEGGTNSAIQGGIFYPLMQISAWGLYNIWSPRAILSFHNFFFENPYRVLSITIIFLIIFMLYKNKKYTPIFFILFLSFFAKGPSPPFGELFIFIINNFPFGYMIRSPDTKFGAFIAAWFVIVIFYLKPNQRIIVTVLTSVFLLTNLVGIFKHGAISSIYGDPLTTTFIEDSESKQLTDLINNHNNTLVIVNFEPCSEELYENKFHTCHGLIATSIKNQVMHSPGNAIGETIEKYNSFPLLILINNRLRNPSTLPNKYSSKFINIYNSDNYSLFYKKSANEQCENWHSFGCVYVDSKIILTIPEVAFNYYYNISYSKNKDGFIVITSELLPIKDNLRLILLFLFGFIYFLLFFIFSLILLKNKFSAK